MKAALTGLLLLCLLYACSGSGSGSSALISGFVVDGPVAGATVQAYVLADDGSVGAPLDSAGITDASGAYTLRLPMGAGPTIIRSTGGMLKDWATGNTYPLGSHHVLSAVLPDITGQATVHITPLTHIAAHVAQSKIKQGVKPAESVRQANSSIGEYFGLADILTVPPIDPAKNDGANGAARTGIDYGMILAGLSHHAFLKNQHPMSLTSALAVDGSDGIFDGKQGNVQLQCTDPQETTSSDLSANATRGDLSKAIRQFQNGPANKSGAAASPVVLGKLDAGSGRIEDGNAVAAPLFLPSNNHFGPNETAVISLNTPVAITTSTAGAQIRYTTDGSTPSQTNGTVYTAPIVMAATTTLQAIAYKTGMQDSTVTSVIYSVYQSPYDISPIFTVGLPDLTADFSTRDALNPSVIIHADWYNSSAPYYVQYPGRITWGPPARQYAAESGAPHGIAWQQQRIIAVAQRYINTQYQHHSLIQWNPPQTWPMDSLNTVLLGHQSQGIDCSDFSLWNYTFGLGIMFTTNVGEQGNLTSVTGPDGSTLPVQTVVSPADLPLAFGTLVAKLQSGDLLYIKPAKDAAATHVVTWIGQVNGQGDYLIIDSHDMHNVTDTNGAVIPTGVQIRPFKQFNDDQTVNWYFQNFWKANRIIGAVVP